MKLLFLPILFITISVHSQPVEPGVADPAIYLNDLKTEMQMEWPKNRTINLVFHGHSVPSGYFKTPRIIANELMKWFQ